ncbi:hypothetical protein EG329_009939 [Mollisiaceae sp. DMI_Dod_QoI]|nr:hypothetical protein EG329_009939 [Helotiales sp. DMI_Dod_QoI]
MASLGGNYINPAQLALKTRELLNKRLESICETEGLKQTGFKQDLRARLIERRHSTHSIAYFYTRGYRVDHRFTDIESIHRLGDKQQYDRLATMILSPAPQPQEGTSMNSWSSASHSLAILPGMGSDTKALVGYVKGSNRLFFKPSPFYHLQSQVGKIKTLNAMPERTGTVTLHITAAETPLIREILSDESLRVMIFCAAPGNQCSNPQDVAFPHSSRVIVNGNEIKANLRGIIGKPGSTKPVDVTHELRFHSPFYRNEIELVYEFTKKKFLLAAYLVRYVKDILDSTNESTDQIALQPNGEWSPLKSKPSWHEESSGEDGQAAEVIDLNTRDDEYEEAIITERQLIGINYELPFTESGYGSLPHLYDSSNVLSAHERSKPLVNTESSPAMNDIDRENARTFHSAATTSGPILAQNYLTELCNDVYSKLGQPFDAKIWRTLSKDLPGLIKAFAIRIGYASSAQVNQEIMYFLHMRHGDIVTQLEGLFRHEGEDRHDIGPVEAESMSLLDKMNMWDNKAGEDSAVLESDDLYQGVNDGEDETTDGFDLPSSSYLRTILNSPAYEWFLAGLRKAYSLQWSATEPRVMIGSIHQKILDKLPTRTISKQQPVSGCRATFHVNLESSEKIWLKNRLSGQPTGPDISFADIIAVTGSSKESQALTIKEYLNQTWPANGPWLLSLLQKPWSSSNSSKCHYITLPDNTQLDAKMTGSYLLIGATGPAHFIAEIGEQLAWLQAAIPSKRRGYYTPSIKDYCVCSSGYCRIDFGVSEPENSNDTMLRAHNSWQDLIGENIIILGFPISRRPEDYPGLELSFRTLLHLLQADTANIENTRSLVVKGPVKALQLVKCIDNVFLWHPIQLPREVHSRTCCGDNHIGIDLTCIDVHSLNDGRHIVGNCTAAQTTVTDDAEQLFERPYLSAATLSQHYELTKGNHAGGSLGLSHNPIAVYQNKSLSILQACGDKEARSGSSNAVRVVDSVLEHVRSSDFDTNHIGRDSIPNNSDTLDKDSQFLSQSGSPNESLDSDMLSMSDSSEQVEGLNCSEPAYPLLNALAQSLIIEFQNTNQYQSSPGENGEGFVTRVSSTGSSTSTGSPSQSRKRHRETNDDEDAGEDDLLRPRRKKINPDHHKTPQRSLACPYLKLDPIKHRSCCVKQLSRIRDVKQHLSRRHTPDRYCQRCLETSFIDEQSLQRHVDLNTCPLKDRALLEGISYQQQRQLSRKSNANLAEESQWFAIWEILFPENLFPGLPRPISAYIDTGLSLDMRLFREYCSIRGPTALREQIESNPEWLSLEVNAEQRSAYLDRAISEGIRRLFESYLRSSTYSSSIRDRTASPSGRGNTSEPPSFPTPAGSSADSGVALDSQLSSSETTYQSGLLRYPPSVGEVDHHAADINDRVPGNLTMRESAGEGSQNYGHNLQDIPPEYFFEDQLYNSELLIFNQVPGFDSH